MVFGLLLLNYALSSSALHSASHLQIPYRPTFLRQVVRDNVSEISSQGSDIQADLRHSITYQGHTGTSVATFVPAFANLPKLSADLAAHHVVVNAKPVQKGPSPWLSILVGFGPAILLVLVFVWFVRRAAARGGGAGGDRRALRAGPAASAPRPATSAPRPATSAPTSSPARGGRRARAGRRGTRRRRCPP